MMDIDETEAAQTVHRQVEAAEKFLDEQQADRECALEYYNGVMNDFQAEKNRSSIVSEDLRAEVKKLMPSIMRTMFSNDKIVEYEPVGPEDEDAAEAATNYVNRYVVPKCNVEKALKDAIFDALVIKTGILKVHEYKKKQAVIRSADGLTEDQMFGLDELDMISDEVDPETGLHSVRIREIIEEVMVEMTAVPRGSFIMTPSADTIEEAPIVGERYEPTRSELISMGYDRDKVNSLGRHHIKLDDTDEIARKGEDWTDQDDDTPKESERVRIYDIHAKLDLDDDGIAEMYRIVYGEGKQGVHSGKEPGRVVLDFDYADEAPYYDVVAERDAHQFEGHSLSEDVIPLQRVRTALLRGGMDAVYWQNNPVPILCLEDFENPEDVATPTFGKPLQLKPGVSKQDAIVWERPPNISTDIMNMMAYTDEMIKDRTGITDMSGGVDPEQFQQMTATSAQLMSESGIAQADMILRSLTRGGIRKAFRRLLKLVVANFPDQNIKVGQDWQTFSPSGWNPEMDCTINVGLGAGSRDRDMAVLQIVLGLQREIISTMGPRNPYVKPEQLYNTLAKITETAGFPSAEPYFTQPDPQEVEGLIQANENKPDPAVMKVEAQMQLEQAKAEANRVKEQAQMEADLRVKEAEQANELEIASLKAQLEYLMHQQKLDLEYTKAAMTAPAMSQVSVPEQLNG